MNKKPLITMTNANLDNDESNAITNNMYNNNNSTTTTNNNNNNKRVLLSCHNLTVLTPDANRVIIGNIPLTTATSIANHTSEAIVYPDVVASRGIDVSFKEVILNYMYI